MYKILAQTVCSIVFLSSILLAKEIPIVKEITIHVPYKEFSVIEFPFKLQGYSFTPFKFMVKNSQKEDKSANVTYVKPTLENNQSLSQKVGMDIKKKLSTSHKTQGGPIDLVKGVNFFRLYPKKVGHTELIVWGYPNYPIMINLEVTKNKVISDKFIKFIDIKDNENKALSFESTYHDRVIKAITKALYNNELPPGYKEQTTKREFLNNGLQIVLLKQYVGKRYMGEEYIINNKTNKTIILDSEMFEQKGIYGVTFINNILSPLKSTKLFVVREKI